VPELIIEKPDSQGIKLILVSNLKYVLFEIGHDKYKKRRTQRLSCKYKGIYP